MHAQYTLRMFAYTVACTFQNADIADEWIAWLRDEHLAEVLSAGALDARVIRFVQAATDPSSPQVRCEVRYHFPSREAFIIYERDHAPRLRAEGLKRFPPERGLSYSRSIGEVVLAL